MNIETVQVSTELLNSSFCDKVFNGQIKEAMENSSLYIRQKLYEDGILRRLFDSRTVTSDELDPLMDSDQPSIICEIEPDASAATFVPFKGTGERRYFSGKRFRIPSGKIEAERMTKSKFELMTIRMPITEWLKENQVKTTKAQQKAIRDAFGEINEDAPIAYNDPFKNGGEWVIDTNLNDTEKIPMKQDIEEYFETEVVPFAPDACMDRSKDKVGCEFPFTRLFYKYRPLRSSEEILAELASLDNTLNEELSHINED